MNASDRVIKYMRVTKCSSRVPRNDVGSLSPNLDDKAVPGRPPGLLYYYLKKLLLMALLS
jgi:hypothetical protein